MRFTTHPQVHTATVHLLPQVDAARVRAKATAPGIMPGQSPAGRSGAAAPRDQPAPPPTGDGAPPPAKQGSAGAEGAEIARPTDSASEGPRPSDSLPVVHHAEFRAGY